jgi:hypothetical protein
MFHKVGFLFFAAIQFANSFGDLAITMPVRKSHRLPEFAGSSGGISTYAAADPCGLHLKFAFGKKQLPGIKPSNRRLAQG